MINAAPLAYILPALCVLKLQQERILQYRNLACILTALFGIGVSVLGLALAVVEMASDRPLCSHGLDLPYCHAPAAAAPAASGSDLLLRNATWHQWRHSGS